ncbi:N-acetylmuramoyl-L-alanine amidase [Kocuria flava]|uniref:peptidoglycan recognition protein family protein n=1 Tax=Kocuria flava TaxID=446860 RepID=UPI001FF1722D|nr:N-acetylmuramoyl-L-alanine amidase [Kocuria flava]MCJ8506251.1 N-acetylmuramoyl-L-alanine amidase [Kocuria flava]
MPYQTGIPAALKEQGLEVELVPGWQTRGSSSFTPRGVVNHWTGGPRIGDRPSLEICINGRPDLAGPLCNVFLTRSGVAVVVAAGRANHAGSGGWKGLVGNSSVFGIEAENSGGGEWTAQQRWSYPRINAALCRLAGINADMVCGHNEWAPTRKIDPHDWPMPAMRKQTQTILDTIIDPLPRKGAPDMLIVRYGRSVYRLITGDRYVAITAEFAENAHKAGIPMTGIPVPDHETLTKTLTAES